MLKRISLTWPCRWCYDALEWYVGKSEAFEKSFTCYLLLHWVGVVNFENYLGRDRIDHMSASGISPINILWQKFYATLFFKHFDWMLKIFNQSKCLKNRVA